MGGVAAGAGDTITGLALSGGVVGAGGVIRGIGLAGVAAGAQRAEGVLVAGGAVGARHARGLLWGGLAAGGETIDGLVVSSAYNRLTDDGRLRGLALSTVNDFRGRQEGLAIGLINYARSLRGVQLGLINIAQNNPVPFRVLPLLNANFSRRN